MKNKMVALVFVLLTIFVVYGFFSLYEPYESVENEGWSDRARRNPYLAAEQFLDRTGIKVTSSYDYEKLSGLPRDGMVFISNASRTMNRKRIDELLDWVKLGGHLVIAAPIHNDDNPDPLLSRFDIKNIGYNWFDDENDEQTTDEEKNDSHKPANKKDKLSREEKIERTQQEIMRQLNQTLTETPADEDEDLDITLLNFNQLDYRFRVHFSEMSSLEHPVLFREDKTTKPSPYPAPFYWAGSEDRIHFMQIALDQGLISVISDRYIWQSSHINRLDHAYLLWFLSKNSSEVILLYGVFTPSLFDYALKYIPELLFIFCIWLLAWLVYRGRRFSPIRDASIEQHRSIVEHIQASAEFLWSEDYKQRLIEPVRKEVLRALQHHDPGFTRLDQEQKINYIQQLTGIDGQQINAALFAQFNVKDIEFTAMMRDLQTIRNTL